MSGAIQVRKTTTTSHATKRVLEMFPLGSGATADFTLPPLPLHTPGLTLTGGPKRMRVNHLYTEGRSGKGKSRL